MVQQAIDNVLVLGHRHQAFLQELFDSARRRQPHLQFSTPLRAVERPVAVLQHFYVNSQRRRNIKQFHNCRPHRRETAAHRDGTASSPQPAGIRHFIVTPICIAPAPNPIADTEGGRSWLSSAGGPDVVAVFAYLHRDNASWR